MMHRHSASRRAMPLLAFGVILSGALFSLAAPCLAIPLPPPRPHNLPGAKPPEQSLPNQMGPEPSPPLEGKIPDAPVGRTPVDLDVNSLPLFNLPQASRERMRECGDAWRNLKLAGQSDGLIWRSFAQKCLSR